MTHTKLKDFKNPMVLQYEGLPQINLSGNSPAQMHRNLPVQYDDKLEAKWAKDMLKEVDYKKLRTVLTFSAAQTKVAGKGHLEAVACRNVFPTNPTIEFHNDRSDHYGGSISIWLHGLNGGEQLQFLLRLSGYNAGGAEIKLGASEPTLYSLVPIDITGSMDLTLGNVLHVGSNPPGGMALIKIDVNFKNSQYGSWLFWDAKIKDLNEGS